MGSTDEDNKGISSFGQPPYPLLTRHHGDENIKTTNTLLGNDKPQRNSFTLNKISDSIEANEKNETSFSSGDENGVTGRNVARTKSRSRSNLIANKTKVTESVTKKDQRSLHDSMQWSKTIKKSEDRRDDTGTTTSTSESDSKTSEHQKTIDIENASGNSLPGKPQKLKFSEIPRRSKLTLMVLAVANFGAGCAFSLPAPFFPREAAKKGASPAVTGIVFSIYELVVVFTTPIFGNFVSEIGPKFMYVAGISGAGCCSVLFGFLDQCPSGVTFIAMALVVRAVEAMGQAAFATASFAIVSAEFPDHISSVFSILETFVAMGLLIGPTLGGTLYQLGGFGLPFWVTGALIISTGILFFGCLPPPMEAPRRRQGHIFALLKSPLVWVAMLLMVAGSSSLGFLDPTLSLYLEEYDLTTLEVSLFFVIAPLLHALLAPLWGYLSDSMENQSPMMVWACITCGLGFLMLGPTPLLQFLPKQIWLVTLGLVSFGCGIGCCIIPTMKCMVIGARELGFDDNIRTYGMVSGLFNAAFHCGAFFGPTFAGVLVERIGFEYSTTVMAGIFALSLLVTTSFFGFRRWRGAKGENLYTKLAEDTSNNNQSSSGLSAVRKQKMSTHTTNEKTPLFQHNGKVSGSGGHSTHDSTFSQCFTMSPSISGSPS